MHAHSINTQYITCTTSSCKTSFDSDLYVLCFKTKQKSSPYTLTSVNYYWVISPDPWWWLAYEVKQQDHHNIHSISPESTGQILPLLLFLIPSLKPICWSAIQLSTILCIHHICLVQHVQYSWERQGEVDPTIADVLLGRMLLPLKFTGLLLIHLEQDKTHKNVWHLWRYFPKLYPEMLTYAC